MKKLNFNTWMLVRTIPPKDLLSILMHISDTSAAVIIMNMTVEGAAGLMKIIKPEKREKILSILIDLESITETALNQILDKVEEEIVRSLEVRYKDFNPKKHLAEMICISDTKERSHMMSAIKEKKKTYFSILEKEIKAYKEKHGVYFFEDIMAIRDMDISSRIFRVDIGIIAMALLDSTDAIKNKIFSNIPSRFREIIEEDMKFASGADPEEIDEAQQTLVEALIRP